MGHMACTEPSACTRVHFTMCFGSIYGDPHCRALRAQLIVTQLIQNFPSFRLRSFHYTISPPRPLIFISVSLPMELSFTQMNWNSEAFIVCISVWRLSNCRKGIRHTQTWHFTKEYDSPPPFVQNIPALK